MPEATPQPDRRRDGLSPIRRFIDHLDHVDQRITAMWGDDDALIPVELFNFRLERRELIAAIRRAALPDVDAMLAKTL